MSFPHPASSAAPRPVLTRPARIAAATRCFWPRWPTRTRPRRRRRSGRAAGRAPGTIHPWCPGSPGVADKRPEQVLASASGWLVPGGVVLLGGRNSNPAERDRRMW